MKQIILISAIAILGFAGCHRSDKSEKEVSNLAYKIFKDVPGPAIKEGDFIAFKAIQKTEEDSVMYDSWKDDRLSFMAEGKPLFKDDLFTGLSLLSEGDSAMFKINLDSLARKLGTPKPANTKGKYMTYVIRIFKVIPKGNLDQQAFSQQVQKYIAKDDEITKSKEPGKISSYISSKGIKPQTTPSGLKYVITKAGTGPKPGKGDTVEVDFIASLLSGKIFETSREKVGEKANLGTNHMPYEPVKAIAYRNKSITGFNEAITMFPAGTKATIILPSNLAYGAQGTRLIMPFTPLVFDIEIVRIVHPKGGNVISKR